MPTADFRTGWLCTTNNHYAYRDGKEEHPPGRKGTNCIKDLRNWPDRNKYPGYDENAYRRLNGINTSVKSMPLDTVYAYGEDDKNGVQQGYKFWEQDKINGEDQAYKQLDTRLINLEETAMKPIYLRPNIFMNKQTVQPYYIYLTIEITYKLELKHVPIVNEMNWFPPDMNKQR